MTQPPDDATSGVNTLCPFEVLCLTRAIHDKDTWNQSVPFKFPKFFNTFNSLLAELFTICLCRCNLLGRHIWNVAWPLGKSSSSARPLRAPNLIKTPEVTCPFCFRFCPLSWRLFRRAWQRRTATACFSRPRPSEAAVMCHDVTVPTASSCKRWREKTLFCPNLFLSLLFQISFPLPANYPNSFSIYPFFWSDPSFPETACILSHNLQFPSFPCNPPPYTQFSILSRLRFDSWKSSKEITITTSFQFILPLSVGNFQSRNNFFHLFLLLFFSFSLYVCAMENFNFIMEKLPYLNSFCDLPSPEFR